MSENTMNDTLNAGFPSFPYPSGCSPDKMLPLMYLPDEVIAQFRLLYTTSDKILIAYLIPAILIFGFLGNGMFLLTLVRIREMRTITTFYLANLAIADLCFILCVAIRIFWAGLRSPRMYTEPFNSSFGCKLSTTVTYMSYFGSIGFITLVSLERFFSICHPVKHRLINSKQRTLKLIATTWVIAILIGICLGTGDASTLDRICILWPPRNPYHGLPPHLSLCVDSSKSISIFSYLLQICAFATSLCMNMVMYAQIVQKLGQNRVRPVEVAVIAAAGNNADGGAPETMEQKRVRHNAAKMLILTGVVFFICLAPWQCRAFVHAITNISRYEIFDATQNNIITFLGTFCNCINSSVNPVIYGVMNARYRVAFLRAISCGRKRDNNDLAATTSTN